MKKLLIILSILILIILPSCSFDKFQGKDMIRAPENRKSPIEGKWSVEKTIAGPYKRGEDGEDDYQAEALFNKDGVIVDGDFVLEPSFKLRNIDLEDYLFYNYKVDLDYLDIRQGDLDAEVITILGDGQYFYEFIRYDDDKIFFYDDDMFVFMKKDIDQVTYEEINRYINIGKNIMRISNKKEIDTLNSGVLLGIKTMDLDEESGIDTWAYRTIWIRSANRNIGQIYQMEDLLVPRKNGFYLVSVNRSDMGGILNDHINSTARGKGYDDFLGQHSTMSARFSQEDRSINYPSILKHILYIGNDYVSVEEVNLERDKKTLRLYPLDYLEDNKPTKVSNLIGEEGYNLFLQSARDAMKTDTNQLLEEESFGLERRNGYWVMKGRLNYLNEYREFYQDFQIKTTIPSSLVHYDELLIPWNIIKSRIPEAIDAFTSPNEDIIIVITREEILVYPIIDNDIVLRELARIKLASRDSIIMAEWGIGRYAGLWEEEFLKNQAKILE